MIRPGSPAHTARSQAVIKCHSTSPTRRRFAWKGGFAMQQVVFGEVIGFVSGHVADAFFFIPG